MKNLAIIFFTIFLFASHVYASNTKPTICQSPSDEIKFKELAGSNVQVLAVCPKKGLYFVEIIADKKNTTQFKERIYRSELKVIKIKTWKKKTETGSKVLMVEFEY